MITHVADGVGTTEARADVLALLTDACLVGGAVVVEHALGSAVGRCALVVVAARARGAAVLHAAHRVGTARARLARVSNGRSRHRGVEAGSVRVAAEAGWARAARLVIHHAALGPVATGALARVAALEADARLVRDALRVGDALVATAVERISDEARQAGAECHTVHQATVGVRSAR